MQKLYIIIKGSPESPEVESMQTRIRSLFDKNCDYELFIADAGHFAEEYNRILQENETGYLAVVGAEDQFEDGYFSTLVSNLEFGAEDIKEREEGDAETEEGKVDANDETAANEIEEREERNTGKSVRTAEGEVFSYVTGNQYFSWMGKLSKKALLNSAHKVEGSKFTDLLVGTVVNLACTGNLRLNPSLPFEQEADFLLRLKLQAPTFVNDNLSYTYFEPDAGQQQCYQGVYYREWYFDSITDFLMPLLEDSRGEDGKIPVFLQYYAMYFLHCRFTANRDNRNRHVLTEEDLDLYLQLVHTLLEKIDDEVILNIHNWGGGYSKDYLTDRMYLRLKYDVPFLDLNYITERNGLGVEYHQNLLYMSNSLRVNILFMEFVNGRLEIDASVPDIFNREQIDYYFVSQNVNYPVEFRERFSLVKYFGAAAYKRYSFHCSIPVDIESNPTQQILFRIQCRGVTYTIPFEFSSHTSRITGYLKNDYWHYGRYLVYFRKGAIYITQYSWKEMARREIGIWNELRKRKKRNFLLLRMGYVLTRPYFKNKKIWMFYDKIYKGGDSSEYLYKYAMKQNDGIRKYYLLDKNAVDYRRMRREGYRPLKRGSILHRLVFLNADMMIVSNSTVFAFNDFYMENSRMIRGIPDFHVVCVQHGLSVQKIALAQQRLRDNTRLYFCASKYEIENLSHPVYDYNGYDALKLTGVPRYDGLVNRDQKQILISPTWRMQSAMQVRVNEGVARDYNPHFKETDYYRVYNSLINDERLIRAAQEYGYKIVYVLHPIVSPQAEDFDTNPYVEIVPSTGEMSYEKLFCESSLMVTDYSGVQFDFAYLRKPLIYHHHRDLEAHYEEGTYHYDTMAFGEITRDNEELIDLLCDYMKNGCVMKEKYRNRADDFFAYDDHNNCQRIYDVMIDYQHNVIEKQRRDASFSGK